jgi:hypothetical protein
MDIFTTQLVKTIQTPIKSTKLKVKALFKESSSRGLKEDLDHLDNHEYYFIDEKKHKKHQQEISKSQNSTDEVTEEGKLYLVQQNLNQEESEKVKKDPKTKPRLDLFV